MIPRRVSLEGLLSYRDPQVVEFGDSSLWMLAGANGSGKSSVFDAVTYALFGVHRGGAQNAAELINKESDSFAIEFDFTLDGELFRARRTLKKRAKGGPAASQQIFREACGAWEPLADTAAKKGFDDWVTSHIGLNFETFTSSVLLLQGRAEKLLDAAAKGRFEVLAGIVDLDRYARLHARADEERKSLRAKAEAAQARLDAIPAVEPAEVEALEARIAAADAARAAQAAELERRQKVEFQSQGWAALQRERAEFDRQWEAGLALLQEAEQVEQAAARARELRAVMPHVEAAIKQQSRIAEAQRKAAELQSLQATAAGEAAAAEQELARTRAVLARLDSELTREDQRMQSAVEWARRLTDSLARVERFEEHERDRQKLGEELCRFPADLTELVRRLEAELDELGAAERALPQLERFAADRDRLREVTTELRQDETREAKIRADGEDMRRKLDEAAGRANLLTTDYTRAAGDLAAAQTLLRHADEQLAAVEGMEGAAVCRACGQTLTPAHLQAERAKRRAEREEARARVAQAERDLGAMKKARDDAERTAGDLTKTIGTLREGYREVHTRNAARLTEMGRLRAGLQQAHSALGGELHAMTAPPADGDWSATTYPSGDDVKALHERVQPLAARRGELQTLRERSARQAALRDQEAELQQRVESLRTELPGEPAAVRQEKVRVDAELQAARDQVDAVRNEIGRSRGEADRQAENHRAAVGRVAALTAELSETRLQERYDGQLLDAALRAVPDSWRPVAERAKLAEHLALKTELDALQKSRAEERAAELAKAKAERDALLARRDHLRGQEAGFPEEARIAPPVAAMAVAEARTRLVARDGELHEARAALSVLDGRRRERHTLSVELLGLEKQHSDARLLAELLDRHHLQRHLVRLAERQIVEFANAVLDRLSGGVLCLRLRAGENDAETDKALELEVFNRETGREAINVAFLSGSQKFRVAVALALGIGQYASRQHRPIESVIIDEGFGCLDRIGRQAMIQELQNLRGHLRCVLLVSHQEEFAEAFPHGYRFELHDGATRVERVER